MKLFATAYINWFDHNLEMSFITAESIEDAMLKKLSIKGWEPTEHDDVSNVDAIKRYAFDGDCMVDAIEIPNAS